MIVMSTTMTQSTARAAAFDRTISETRARLEAELATLRSALEAARAPTADITANPGQIEDRLGDIAKLYAAASALETASTREETIQIAREIVCNLVGSEQLAFFSLDAGGTELALVSALGIDTALYERMRANSGPIGRALELGLLCLASPSRLMLETATDGRFVVTDGSGEGSDPVTACVPLRAGGNIVGALAIFRMLPQKPELLPSDIPLLELLSTSAGCALASSRA